MEYQESAFSKNKRAHDLSTLLKEIGATDNFVNHPAMVSLANEYRSVAPNGYTTNYELSVVENDYKIPHYDISYVGEDLKGKISISVSDINPNEITIISTVDQPHERQLNTMKAEIINTSMKITNSETIIKKYGYNGDMGTYSSAIKTESTYDKDGINTYQEKSFYDVKFYNLEDDRLSKIDDMYNVPVNAWQPNSCSRINRTYFDVANYVYERNGVTVDAYPVYLSGEHGYRKMKPIDASWTNFTIEPLTKNSIDKRLLLENDPAVRNALKEKYTNGRENYSYNPFDNKAGFLRDGKSASDFMIDGMVNGTIDINGQPINQNDNQNTNSRSMGFTGVPLLAFVSLIATIVVAVVGILIIK